MIRLRKSRISILCLYVGIITAILAVFLTTFYVVISYVFVVNSVRPILLTAAICLIVSLVITVAGLSMSKNYKQLDIRKMFFPSLIIAEICMIVLSPTFERTGVHPQITYYMFFSSVIILMATILAKRIQVDTRDNTPFL